MRQKQIRGEEPIVDYRGQKRPTQPLQYVSFTDIPFALLKHHIRHYGNVGIGFKREFIIKHHGQPVIYVPEMNGGRRYSDWAVSSLVEKWNDEWSTLIGDLERKKTLNRKEMKRVRDTGRQIEHLRKYIKQFSFNEPHSSYYEREWRILGTLHFKLTDIETVIMPKKFVTKFLKLFPGITTSVAELILS